MKLLNLQKRIAIIENFKFLTTNANARQYARVTTSVNISIALLHGAIKLHGVIFDLSIHCIAIMVKHTKELEKLRSKNVSLVFNIPTKRVDTGFWQLKLEADITAIIEKDGKAKVICELNEDSSNESMLMEYIYDRQKELIVEIKKMSQLNHRA